MARLDFDDWEEFCSRVGVELWSEQLKGVVTVVELAQDQELETDGSDDQEPEESEASGYGSRLDEEPEGPSERAEQGDEEERAVFEAGEGEAEDEEEGDKECRR